MCLAVVKPQLLNLKTKLSKSSHLLAVLIAQRVAFLAAGGSEEIVLLQCSRADSARLTNSLKSFKC